MRRNLPKQLKALTSRKPKNKNKQTWGPAAQRAFHQASRSLKSLWVRCGEAIWHVCSWYARQFINPRAIPKDSSSSVPWVIGRNKQRCEATGQIAASVYKLLVGIFYVCIYVYLEILMHVEKKCSQCMGGGPLSVPQPQDIKFLSW